MTTPTIVDLFAGPGGWDIAARDLGLDPIGIELSASACATRAANGLATIRASVADYAPERFGHITGLIASPPCPLFSSAGTAAGDAPECHPSLFSPGLAPWISMADALATTEPFSTHTLRGAGMIERSGGRRPRGHDEPAPTITASLDNGNKRWTVNTHTDQRPDGTTQERPLAAPAPTITGKSGGQWTMALEDDTPTIRLTTEQAAALQTFPPAYRFAGTKTAVFQQIGNAVPPTLARHILTAVTP